MLMSYNSEIGAETQAKEVASIEKLGITDMH